MATTPLRATLQHIRNLAAVGCQASQSDRELLRAYLDHNDQDAFAALVTRHGPLVLGVCRRVLIDEHGAEDAFQATFLLLARNGTAIRKQDAIASWLYGVASRVAGHAKRSAVRRRRHEREAIAMRRTATTSDLSWREVQAALDEELRRLPEIHRAAFVLCVLENRSCADVARELAVPETTVWNRVARARKLLRAQLAARGLTLSALLGVAALGHDGLQAAVPAGLVRATMQAVALAGTRGAAAGIVSAEVLRLMKGANQAMLSTKAKCLAVLLALAALIGTSVSLSGGEQRTGTPPAGAQAPAKAGAAGKAAGDGARQASEPRVIEIKDEVYAVACGPNGMAAVVLNRKRPDGGIKAGIVQVWDMRTGKLKTTLEERTTGFHLFCRVTFSRDGKYIAASGGVMRNVGGGMRLCGEVTVWDAQTGTQKQQLVFEDDHICGVAFSADSKRVAAGSCFHKGKVPVWDIDTGRLVKTFEADEKIWITSLAFAPDDKTLVAGGGAGNGRVVLWETETGKFKYRVADPAMEGVNQVAFSPDGQRVAVGGIDATVRVLDARTGVVKHLLNAHVVRDLAFTPDGKTLATAGHDHKIHLWDFANEKIARTLEGHRDSVAGVAIAPDGRLLVSGGSDGTLRIWPITLAAKKGTGAPGAGEKR